MMGFMGDAAAPTIVVPGVWPPPGSPGAVPAPTVTPSVTPVNPAPPTSPGTAPTPAESAALGAFQTAYGQMSPGGQASAYAIASGSGQGATMLSGAKRNAAIVGGAIGIAVGFVLARKMKRR